MENQDPINSQNDQQNIPVQNKVGIYKSFHDYYTGRLFVLAGIVIITFALIFFIPFFSKKQIIQTFTPRPSSSATPNLTADWKTYRNDQYGFEFKYPAEGKVINDSIFPNANELVSQAAISFEVLPLGTTIGEAGDNWQAIQLDGKSAHSLDVGSEVGGPYRWVVIMIDIDQELKIVAPLSSPVYNQILSTFKFTK